VAVVGLLLLGSVIGSAHTRDREPSDVTPTATATDVVVRTRPAVTVTATAPATTPAAGSNPAFLLVAYGTGSGQTAAFTAVFDSFEAVYTYDCTLLGSRGHFVANLYRNGDNVGPIADTAGTSGQGSTELANGAATFAVRVATRCSWTVVIDNFYSFVYPGGQATAVASAKRDRG